MLPPLFAASTDATMPPLPTPTPVPGSAALVVASPPADGSKVRRAEERLAELIAGLEKLEAEVEKLEDELEHFAGVYEEAVGPTLLALDRFERHVHRLRRLQDAVASLLRRLETPVDEGAVSGTASGEAAQAGAPAELADDSWEEEEWDEGAEELPPDEAAGEEPQTASPGARGPTDARGHSSPGAEAKPVVEELPLKRLYRRLARLLHPDLAQDEAERKRLGALMAQVNVAYGDGDRSVLEVIAAKVGAGEEFDGVSDQERLAHLERRIATLEAAAAAVKRRREGLRATATARLREEAQRRKTQGRDYLTESRDEVRAEMRALGLDVRTRLRRLERAARALSTARNQMTSLRRRADSSLQPFDPVLESGIVRRGVLWLERQRATPPARNLALLLEDAATEAPWQLALTVAAYFAEIAGRPPPGLASSEVFAERYELLRAKLFPTAPTWDEALPLLPYHLVFGLRADSKEVRFGLQLREAELLAAVPLALQRAGPAAIAREVLSLLGPRETCRACGESVLLVHLLRTRGLDERNGLVCPLCASVQKSYWLYSPQPEGLEALLAHSLRLKVVREQAVRLAGATVAFQFLPEERQQLTAAALRQRFVDLYLQPYAVELDPVQLLMTQNGARLEAEAPVAKGVVELELAPEAGMPATELLELLRGRIERRFRSPAAE